jgi:hypothetical protein
MATRYKFVELSVVTEESLEKTVNEWVAQGWNLDAIRFVTGEQSRRPQMAFVSFVRDEPDGDEAVTLPLPARSEIRRKHKILELGEIDPGDIEPYDADLDWESAVTKPGRPVAREKQKQKKPGKKK